MNYVIPIVPRITGQVTEVPIEPNRPIKKGDVLFKIDPVPFEAAVKAAEATLAMNKVKLVTAEATQRGLEDQLKNATAKKAALVPRIDLAKKRVEQFANLAASGAGTRADLEQAQSDLGNLESEFLVRRRRHGIARCRSKSFPARKPRPWQRSMKSRPPRRRSPNPRPTSPARNTISTGARRPSRCQPGQMAVWPIWPYATRACVRPTSPPCPLMEFHPGGQSPQVLAFYRQNEVRYVEPGNDMAEIFVKRMPRVASSSARCDLHPLGHRAQGPDAAQRQPA